MLLECAIRNFAVIESLRVHFGQGFHVLTGETGAGKSMIVDALGLIAGGRGSSEWVRHGADKAEIECLFDVPAGHPVRNVLSELGIDTPEEEMLVVRREISAQGKSVSRVNGQIVNLTMLRQIGEWLVNIHGQHEHQSLMNSSHQLMLLDTYGSDKIHSIKANYEKAFKRYQEGQKELREMEQNHKDHLHKMDLYKFQAEEIASAALKSGEDAMMGEERKKLANAEKLMNGATQSYEALYGHRMALEQVTRAVQKLEEIAKHDPTLSPLATQMQEAYYQLEDAAFQLRDYREQIEFNPARLDQIEQRLDLFNGLRRKYGESVDDIIAYHGKIQNELTQLERFDDRLLELQQQVDKERVQLMDAGERLSAERKKLADVLSGKIMAHLRELHMEKTIFHIGIESMEEPTASGLDVIEFQIAPNPGEPLRPLGKIASGGELSRMMLAIKSIFAEVERIPVLVFDEVDTGVSGRAAQSIAEKMARLSDTCQVFAVTHLPQVACMADKHYLIEKQVDQGRTFTNVRDMDNQERISEMARMLGGVEVTAMTTEHAQEMLSLAERQKKQWRQEVGAS